MHTCTFCHFRKKTFFFRLRFFSNMHFFYILKPLNLFWSFEKKSEYKYKWYDCLRNFYKDTWKIFCKLTAHLLFLCFIVLLYWVNKNLNCLHNSEKIYSWRNQSTVIIFDILFEFYFVKVIMLAKLLCQIILRKLIQ